MFGGESFVVVAVADSDGTLAGEFFILTTRPKEALQMGSTLMPVGDIPPELGPLHAHFALDEAQRQAELVLFDGLEARALELGRPDVAFYPFELRPTTSGRLFSCWWHGQFNEQLRHIGASTKCRPLARYVGLLAQTQVMRRPS